MLRQWERQVSEKVLRRILFRIVPVSGCRLLVIRREVLSRIDPGNGDKELIIKTDGDQLITCFYCEFAEYRTRCRECSILIVRWV
ncbi:MAG: hypothetical protein JNL57_10835 [Bacteroidetes bacterium]|nr:hypothetical protein [Bacteroidota bacterium]